MQKLFVTIIVIFKHENYHEWFNCLLFIFLII